MANIMKNALNYSKSFRIPIICHCEDADLTRGGHMNEGAMSTLLGVWGMPSIAEEVIVARDIMLAPTQGRVCILRTCQPPGRCASCATRKNSGSWSPVKPARTISHLPTTTLPHTIPTGK